MVSATAKGETEEMKACLYLLSLTLGLLSLTSPFLVRWKIRKMGDGEIGEAFVTYVTLFPGRTLLLLEDGGYPVKIHHVENSKGIPPK